MHAPVGPDQKAYVKYLATMFSVLAKKVMVKWSMTQVPPTNQPVADALWKDIFGAYFKSCACALQSSRCVVFCCQLWAYNTRCVFLESDFQGTAGRWNSLLRSQGRLQTRWARERDLLHPRPLRTQGEPSTCLLTLSLFKCFIFLFVNFSKCKVICHRWTILFTPFLKLSK